MDIGLIIVGDEILSGRRSDKHLPQVVETLTKRGLTLSWVKIIGDDKTLLDKTYKDSLASDNLVFSAGGIGATPDDMTRESVARALGINTERHPEGAAILEKLAEERNMTLSESQYQLVQFPQNASLIPNPVNTVPGFSIHHHHFVPGFPEMAWPMIEWVLDTHYGHLTNDQYIERAIAITDRYESDLIPLMELLEKTHPEVKVFCLPSMKEDNPLNEFGLKGHASNVKEAYETLKGYLNEHEFKWSRLG